LGIHLIGLGGFNNYIGYPGQDAITLTVAYTDYLTPPLSITTIMGALDYREKTGKGQYIDISQLEAGLHFQGTPILDYNVNGRQPQFVANKCEIAAPHNTYRCKGEDRWCAIAVFNDTEWAALCTVLNHPELINDPRFDTLEKRKQNEDSLNQTIESITINYTPEELMDSLQKKEIAAGVVKNAKDIYEDVQLRARDYFWPMNHPEMGEFTHSGQPAILSKTPAKPVMPAPCIGEHTEYICKDLLGMDDEEFITNMALGAFGF
jgi:benzylsuccinate CoA-transferase BbsF subunit